MFQVLVFVRFVFVPIGESVLEALFDFRWPKWKRFWCAAEEQVYRAHDNLVERFDTWLWWRFRVLAHLFPNMVFDSSCHHLGHQQLLQMFRLDVVPDLAQISHVDAVTVHVHDQSFERVVFRLHFRVDFDQIAVCFYEHFLVRVEFSSLLRLSLRIFAEIFLWRFTGSFFR